jgi:hypothetical protein
MIPLQQRIKDEQYSIKSIEGAFIRERKKK